ncbi:MAG: transporter related [Deltaproteobacteria bacterium]|jgi:branched-chain amino acid transport system ATP-binding protein|nr:transporter related [Deltaproteobacteria bacterium]
MLTIEHLDVHYGDLQVLWDISLEVHTGEIVAMVGSNGAGKSTLIRTIAGLHRPTRGLIGLEGLPMQGLTPHRIVDLGVSMVPEGRRLFPKMTVLQNLEIGAFLPRARKEKDATLESVYEIFPILKARSRQAAGLLSGGEQQMLAIGRALMAKSKLLLLDEMSLGLSPIVVQQMFDVVLRVNREGIAIFMVEQNVPMTLKVAHRAYVMESGRIVMQGPARELVESKHVKEAYLGVC